MIDLYKVLNVSKNVTSDDLKKTYHVLAKKYHPDLNPGNITSENKFKEINSAYDILSNVNKRALYDMQYERACFQAKMDAVNRSVKESNEIIREAQEKYYRQTQKDLNRNQELGIVYKRIGHIAAFAFSCASGNSLGWVIIHTLFGWYYVGYFIFTHVFSIQKF